MSAVLTGRSGDGPAAAAGPVTPATGGVPEQHPPERLPADEPVSPAPVLSVLRTVSSMVLVLSTVVLVFAVYIGVFSSLHHTRAQYTSYANFRQALAQGQAPVGPMKVDNLDTKDVDESKEPYPPGTAVAVIHIPRIHVREVVFEGTTGSILQNGPGHLRTTPLPGQAGISVIMGRAAAYGGPFGGLSRLNPGDTFTVTTGQGVSTFRVLGVRRGGDPYPPPLAVGGSRLTLTTAYGPPLVPTGVLRVDADRIEPALPTPANPLTRRDLSSAELALGTDQFAWVQLVLWGQALVGSAVLLTWVRLHWGRWQVWVVAVPVLVFFSVATADQLARLLPNLL